MGRADDPPGTQFYGMSVFPDHGVYYGFVWVYHPNPLMIDVQLTFSRDGIAWQRAGRRHPILMYGLPHQFDSHMLMAMRPILMSDEIKVFYIGFDAPHAVVYLNEAYPPLTAPFRSAKTASRCRSVGTAARICRRRPAAACNFASLRRTRNCFRSGWRHDGEARALQTTNDLQDCLSDEPND